uniref:Secreted protein n=1 Tax=Anguilla anguilla TaxID=7936 RepID=A0A0E9WUS3_ANGAN
MLILSPLILVVVFKCHLSLCANRRDVVASKVQLFTCVGKATIGTRHCQYSKSRPGEFMPQRMLGNPFSAHKTGRRWQSVSTRLT